MARVLLAWEYGGDLGHARRVLAIARGLRALGHETAFAFRDLGALGAAQGERLEWFQAPLLALPASPNPSPLNASDILLALGFDDAAGIAGVLRGWRNLVALWRPDLLVADYAPAALLGARSVGLARISIGTGFTTPPPGDPQPALRPWAPVDAGALRRIDARLVAAVREAHARIDPRLAAPASATEVFDAPLRLVCTWPELDPYAPRSGVEYLGPQDEGNRGAAIDWLGSARPRVLAYLKPRDPRFAAIVEAVRALGGEAIVAAPGIAAADAAGLASPGVRMLPHAVDVERLLPGADLCVSHAGTGLTARALAAGVPMALLPMQLEQYLVARGVEALGAGALLSPEEKAPDVRAWLARVAARADLRAAAGSSPLRGRVAASAAERIARALAA